MKIKLFPEIKYYIYNGVVYKVENGEVEIPDQVVEEQKEEKTEAKKTKKKEE